MLTFEQFEHEVRRIYPNVNPFFSTEEIAKSALYVCKLGMWTLHVKYIIEASCNPWCVTDGKWVGVGDSLEEAGADYRKEPRRYFFK